MEKDERKEAVGHPEVTIENLGPIVRAKIKLAPLTVFVGDNGSGKTYTSLVLNAVRNRSHLSVYLRSYSSLFVLRE